MRRASPHEPFLRHGSPLTCASCLLPAARSYDRLGPPPSFDDRRYPAEDCLTKLGAAQLDAASLWGVMTSNPTRNALTTLTMIMNAHRGHFEAYKTECTPGPHCAPF